MNSADERLARLKAELSDWKSVSELQALFGWRDDTVRGRVSDLKRSGAYIERKRENGVTSYRVSS